MRGAQAVLFLPAGRGRLVRRVKQLTPPQHQHPAHPPSDHLTYPSQLMEESAYFGVYRRRWSVPLDGGAVRLPRLIGEGRALEIILTGRKVPAQESLNIGLCEYVVPDGDSRAIAEELTHQIAQFPQICMCADRRSVRKQHDL